MISESKKRKKKRKEKQNEKNPILWSDFLWPRISLNLQSDTCLPDTHDIRSSETEFSIFCPVLGSASMNDFRRNLYLESSYKVHDTCNQTPYIEK